MRLAIYTIAVTVLAASASAAVAVNPASLYEARFRARVTDGPTLEEHPQLIDLVPLVASHFNSTKVRFAGFNWTFRKREGGRVVPRPYLGSSQTILFHRGWRDFSIRFWTPENASLFDLGASRGVEIAGLAVEEAEPGATLNHNPRFDAADEYVPGWQISGAAQFMRDGAGVNYVFAEEGRILSDLFAVKPGSRVKVVLRGVPSKYALENANFTACVYFFADYAQAAVEKTAVKRRSPRKVRITGRNRESSYVYNVPEDARWARVTASGGNVYECAVTLHGARGVSESGRPAAREGRKK